MNDAGPQGAESGGGARRLALFAVAGVLGLIVDVGVLYLLAPWLGWYGARVLSFLGAATATWAFNRRFTFAVDRPASLWREYVSYVVAMLGGAAVNYAVYVLTLHSVEGPWAAALGVALGSLCGMVVNYLSARHLVFRSRGPR
ncbi:MAG: GtrA family protein [Variovorax paradoxus]|uniref:GtrA family protein n=1 Tax=Variovorax paradoxus TaxID=34073 RepID=A0A2W5Q9F4_VARPD|nr:MAG: GtrA family protein [Variovorax paradoxus]